MANHSKLEFFRGGWKRVGRENRPTVIDTHCHVFPRLGESKGWNPAINTKLCQYHMRDCITF